MHTKVFCCVDIPEVFCPENNIKKWSGWILSTGKIEGIKIRIPHLKVRYAVYGNSIPDIIKNFGCYPNKEKCGFSFEVSCDQSLEIESFILFLKIRSGSRSRSYKMHINACTNKIQSHLLSHYSFGERFFLSLVEKKIMSSLKKQGPWVTIKMDITNQCNLRCKMCHCQSKGFREKRPVILTEKWFDENFVKAGPYIKQVVLSCSFEPLLSKHFAEIISLISDKYPHVNISFCTNAMLMNQSVRELVITKNVTHIMLSIDGVTKRTLESIRRGADFNKIIGNIMALRDLKKKTGKRFPLLTANYVMMNSNIHEGPLFVEACAILGIGSIDFRHVVPNTFFQDTIEMLSNHKAKYNYYHSKVVETANKFKIHISIPDPYGDVLADWYPDENECVSLEDFNQVKPDSHIGELTLSSSSILPDIPKELNKHLSLFAFCSQPFHSMVIANGNEIKPCPWYKENIGTLNDGNTLKDIFWGRKYTNLRMDMLDSSGNPDCEKCPIHAGFFSLKGSGKRPVSRARLWFSFIYSDIRRIAKRLMKKNSYNGQRCRR